MIGLILKTISILFLVKFTESEYNICIYIHIYILYLCSIKYIMLLVLLNVCNSSLVFLLYHFFYWFFHWFSDKNPNWFSSNAPYSFNLFFTTFFFIFIVCQTLIRIVIIIYLNLLHFRDLLKLDIKNIMITVFILIFITLESSLRSLKLHQIWWRD